jgi:hypothetical protein
MINLRLEMYIEEVDVDVIIAPTSHPDCPLVLTSFYSKDTVKNPDNFFTIASTTTSK